jgi:hypothetical protein
MTTLRAWIIASLIAFPGGMLGGTLLLQRVACLRLAVGIGGPKGPRYM